MKHGRIKRTVAKPDWYRRWEAGQYIEKVMVMGDTIICRPELLPKLMAIAETPKTDPYGVTSGITFPRYRIVSSPHLPAPLWNNRKRRRADAHKKYRERDRRVYERANEQRSFEKRVNSVCKLLHGYEPYPTNRN